MGFFSSGKSKVKWSEPGYSTEARNWIEDLYKKDVGPFPLQETAGMTDAERQAQNMIQTFMQSGPGYLDDAAQFMFGLLNREVDPMKIPGMKGVIDKVTEEGQLQSQALARGLNIGGNFTSRAGQDELGRSVTGTQERLLGAMMPYVESAYNRQFNAGNALSGMQNQFEQGILNRINAGVGPGSLERIIQEIMNQRQYTQQMAGITAPYQYNLPAAQTNVVSPQATVTGGGSSGFSKVMDIASIVAPIVMPGVGSLVSAGIRGAKAGGLYE